MRWLPAVLPLCAALAMGCHGQVGDVGDGGGQLGGMNGGDGGVAPPCTGMSDPRMVVAGQRIMLMTKPQLINTVRYLIDDTEAQALLAADMFMLTKDSDRKFPPAQEPEQETFDNTNILPINNLASNVSDYVAMNFTTLANTLAKCNTATDACATTYLNALAVKAYRRQLTADEQTRFTNLYSNLRNQMINGYAMTNTVEQATGYAVWALLMSPQLQWLWETGGIENGKQPQTSTSPAGIYVSDDELASQLSFFMTDGPPDDTTLAAAKAGTLRANLATHVSRLLGTQAAKDWLRHVMELYFLVNQLPNYAVDPTKFPIDEGLVASMQTETQMFLDNALWGGGSKLNDMLLSRTSFINSRLANEVYMVPVPTGANANDPSLFGQATLPADRVGILTNAGFLTARSRSDGQDLVSRGKSVKAAFLCLISTPPTDSATQAAVAAASKMLSQESGQDQAATRAKAPVCAQCHATFDSYGLVLEFYDAIARYRTTYDYLPGMPTIDGTTTLPDLLGGATVHTAADLAQNLTQSPTFINCLAKSMLQYAMTDLTAAVELPLPPSQAGCAAADVVQRYQAGGTQTYTGLITAVTQSPAFVVRNVTP